MIKVDATNGRVQFRDGEGRVWLSPCRAAVVLADGRRYAFDDDARPESGVDGLVVRQRPGDGPELRWHFQPRPAEGALGMWLEVHNPTGEAIALVRLDVLIAPEDTAQPEAEQPWMAVGPRLLIGFASPGAPQCTVAPGLTASQPVAMILPPGGTLPSELLWLVAGRDQAEAHASYVAAVQREGG